MRRLAAILILIIVAAPGYADLRTSITVRPECEVAGSSVLISEISAVRSSSPEIAAKIRSAEVGPSPSPGRSKIVSRDDIVIAIRRAGIDDRTVDLLCPRQITVARSFRRVTGQEIFEAAKEYAAKATEWVGTIGIEPVRLPSDADAPTGKMELQVRPGLRTVRRGQNSINVAITIDGKDYRVVNTTLMIKQLAPVLVATQAISKSTPLTMANVVIAERDITMISDDAMVNELPSGVVASIPISNGALIRKSWLASPAVVHSGDDVLITVESGAVRLVDKGTAIQEGSIGQVVRIRLSSNAQEVRAAVTGPGTAKISIPGGS